MRAARGLRLVLLASTALAGGGHAAGEDSRAAAVDEIFAQYDGDNTPGVAVGVALNGETLLARGYGLAHLEHAVPVTADTVFHVASVSKQFAAFSAALLAAEGKLDLDADVRRHFPELPDFGAKVSPRHLVHHTSGLKDQWTLFVLGGMELDNRLRQRQILAMASRVDGLNFAPGSDYTYSNTGYTLLAELVARVSGQSFRDFTDARIFAPLGMGDTLFYDDVTEIVERRAQSYEKGDNEEWRRSPFNFDNVGATSLHTTVTDLLRWGDNFLRPVIGRGAPVEALFRMGALDDGTPLGYGFGLQRRAFGGHEALMHTGADAGYRSIFAVFPDDGLVVAAFANSPVNLLPALAQIAAIYLEAADDPDAWRAGLPGSAHPTGERLEELAGHYYSPARPPLRLRREGDTLVDAAPDGDSQPVTFRSDGSFDFGDEDRLWGTHYRLVRGDDGAIAALAETGGSPVAGQTTIFRRYEEQPPGHLLLEAIAGDYRNDALDVTWTLAVTDGELRAEQLWSAGPVTLHPTIPDHFTGDWPYHDVAVERGADGRPAALRVSSLRARDVRFERVAGSDRSPMTSAELDRVLDELTRDVPGVSAAVATRNGLAWTGTAGWSDLDARQPLRGDELFGIGSITKTFVSVVLQQLAAEGRVDLDAAPAAYLGEELEGIANTRNAALFQLMNHTSGIPSWEDQPDWQRDGRGQSLDPTRIWGKADTLPYIVGLPALFAPGERYSYSNSNFTILGMVVEAVTGQDLVDVIEERIRRPAGLSAVFLEGFEPVPGSKLATRYHFATGDFRQSAGLHDAFRPVGDGLVDVSATNLSVEWAAGGMVATAADLARYGVAVFDGTLLNDASLERLQTFRPVREPRPGENGAIPETGLGVFRRRIGDHEVLGHGGDVLGYSAWLYWVPRHGVALAILTNAGTMHAGPGVGAGAAVLGDGRFIDAAVAVAGQR